MEWLEKETLWPREDLELIVATITGPSPLIVLAGPPGTGKTWVAQRIARYLTGGTAGSVRLVQFHPSYAYEQFIEGLRPVVEPGGGIAFRRVDGVVLDMVSGMHGSDDRRVLVIDEMNRANLPRVFGELMYLFEYREEPIALQYSPSFSLPRGLLFIGTMNTADRSIRSLDIALRRRFDVFECPPSTAILARWYNDPEHRSELVDLIGGFERLNADLTNALDRHHTIGHTFFLADLMSRDRLHHVWRHKLAPLIEEYFFDQPDLAAGFSVGTYWPEVADAH
jgi:5-methylcytosine-specific restriction endonuclease McrBC GTP-binding regulatory subunit McrB